MINQKLINTFLMVIFNGMVALIAVVLFQYASFSLNIDFIINWMAENTKKFAISVFFVFIVLLLTAKFQFRVFEKFKKSYPWCLTLFKYMYIFLLSGFMASITSYYLVYFQLLKDPVSTIGWIGGNTRIFFAGMLFLYFIFLLVFSLLGNIYISSILTAVIILLIGFVHYNKLNLRVEPLYPSDFSQITQIKDVIPMVKDYLSIKKAIIIVLLVGTLLYLIKFLPKVKIPIWIRTIMLILMAGMIYSYTFFPATFMKNFIEKTGTVTIIKWDQLKNYNKNGFVFGFISNLQNDAFDEPNGYSKQQVIAIANKYKEMMGTRPQVKGQSKKPNIVYIMSEAFWDPTKLPNVHFSEDPMKNLRNLMQKYSSGSNLSPAFGGATANVEFEAVTGYSNYFLRVGSLPYQDLIDRKKFIPTMVSDLEKKGYQTLAIHPYNKVFYKRDRVYKTFGIDQFLDMSTMKNQEKSGPYISDESLSKEIMEQLKNNNKSMFIHAVSVQNHFPYLPKRYEKNTIKVSGLSDQSNQALEVYAEGIRQADAALQLLVDNLEQLDEPTVVVFWGDHMPILGQDLAIYKEANYANTKDKNSYGKQYSETPLLIYSNYPLEKQELHSLSPNYFGPTVYNMIGLKNPPFYNLLDLLKEEIPGLKVTLQIDGNQKSVTSHLTKRQKQLLKDYEMLEYDLLVGKQYSKEILF
ncbi:LTA synthase family protein [Neobacillus drentensis]|uniref:LTA synthase family protein n=1 Tax=Neobacillus drentensis TaxID=220684 RepID=UPI003000791E